MCDEAGFHTSYWIWRRTHAYDDVNASYAVEVEDEAADGAYVVNELLVEKLSAYMSGA